MLIIRTLLLVAGICFCCNYASAETRDLQTCETQLNKYRKFLLQAILSFEEVCDAYSSRLTPIADLPKQITLFGRLQPTEQRSEVWQFFRILMAQFNDMEFSNIIREAVIERCRLKVQPQQQQRDEKRNSVVLGKKQRFHSWGGKRSNNDLEEDRNDDIILDF